MKYEYTVDEDYPEGAIEFESSWSVDNAEYVAGDAAEAYYDCDPDPDIFPIEIDIFGDGKKIGEFEVHLDFSPDFTAVPR